MWNIMYKTMSGDIKYEKFPNVDDVELCNNMLTVKGKLNNGIQYSYKINNVETYEV